MAHNKSNSEMVALIIDRLKPWIQSAESIPKPEEAYQKEVKVRKDDWRRAAELWHEKSQGSEGYESDMEKVYQLAGDLNSFEKNRDAFTQEGEGPYQEQHGQHIETLLNKILGVIGHFASFEYKKDGLRASIRTTTFADHMFEPHDPLTIPRFSNSPTPSHLSTPPQDDVLPMTNGENTIPASDEDEDDEDVASEPRPIKRKASFAFETPATKKQRARAKSARKRSTEDEEIIYDGGDLSEEDEHEYVRETRRSSRRTQGITNPEIGTVYLAFHRSKHWYPSLVLPLGDFSAVGIPGDLEDSGLLGKLPPCYNYDSETGDVSWKRGFEDKGPSVSKRKFAVFLFDDVVFPDRCSFDWVSAQDLIPYDGTKCDKAHRQSLATWLRQTGRETSISSPTIEEEEGEEGEEEEEEDEEEEEAEGEEEEQEENDNDEKHQPTASDNITTISETSESVSRSTPDMKEEPSTTLPIVPGSSSKQPVIIPDDVDSSLTSLSGRGHSLELANGEDLPDAFPSPEMQQLATRALDTPVREIEPAVSEPNGFMPVVEKTPKATNGASQDQDPSRATASSPVSHGTARKTRFSSFEGRNTEPYYYLNTPPRPDDTPQSSNLPRTLTPLQRAVERGYDGVPIRGRDKIETLEPEPTFLRPLRKPEGYTQRASMPSIGTSSRSDQRRFAPINDDDDIYGPN